MCEDAIVSYDKTKIAAIKAPDGGYNSSWVPSNSIDGIPSTAYSSKDNTSKKYLQYELEEAAALDAVYVIGRYSSNEPDGTFANRINAAKIYASNTDMSANLASLGSSDAPLVGTVSGVTATSGFVPDETEINTKGTAYKYYLLYFDTVNNGSNISLAVSEIGFYAKTEKVKIDAKNADGKLVVTLESEIDGEYTLILGSYKDDEILISATRKDVLLEKDKALSIEFENVEGESLALFLWNNLLVPTVKKVIVN